MIRNALIGLATLATAAALAAPASANSYGHSSHSYRTYAVDYDGYQPVCHTEKRKVFGGYDECGRKIWVWKRVRSCH
ncbi:hypothetical protein [Aurantimonas sp. VKM B-3413]|uniref:hypothetical protein n=1 Tax=Aurantimonas sp. VKM B-3413 TaxID=2779401 RepID=UPI001E6056E4|nr:hypothetical protein [Aurantimonas sp. VKM B-3413]MCB8837748.1 hypothetical protein [Aurantimonas sp. VKM B-3413]